MRQWLRRRREPTGLLPLDEVLATLGRDGKAQRRTGDVPIDDIIGSANRTGDFDEDFHLINPALQQRWQRIYEAMQSGMELPPVHLVQLGELYFVVDGHHRVSVARSLGRQWVTARIQHVCTVAYATRCLRAAHLPTKAAERRFLERVPLPDDIRKQLWLDNPADWSRLTDAAEAWGLRQAQDRHQLLDRCQLATYWWHEEVEPLVRHLRDIGAGVDLPAVQMYVTALALRDNLGETSWQPQVISRLAARLPTGRERPQAHPNVM